MSNFHKNTFATIKIKVHYSTHIKMDNYKPTVVDPIINQKVVYIDHSASQSHVSARGGAARSRSVGIVTNDPTMEKFIHYGCYKRSLYVAKLFRGTITLVDR